MYIPSHCTVYIIYRLSQTHYIFASQNSDPKSAYMSRTDKGGSVEHVYRYISIYHTYVAMYIMIIVYTLLYARYTQYVLYIIITYIEAFEWSTMYRLFRESSLQHPLQISTSHCTSYNNIIYDVYLYSLYYYRVVRYYIIRTCSKK